MFLLVLMLVTAGKFQTGKLVGGTLAESEQTAMQPIPKPIAVGRANVGSEFQRQRSVTGANQIFAQLNFIRRENTDAAPPA